jgi:hypothetical protein
MRDINFQFAVAVTTAQTIYIPVPVRGVIAGIKAAYNQELDADETLTVARASTAVAVVTPTDALAAGTELDGVMDSTNGQLIFDPDSSTVANKVIKLTVPNTFDTAGVLAGVIKFDDSAYVTQAPSEA